jgi:CBS domain-containing protein
VATYRMVYGDEEQVVHETFDDVEVEREDGWTVLFRGGDAILRLRDEHVQSLERVQQDLGDDQAQRGVKKLTVSDLMRPAVTSVEKYAHLAAAAYLMKQGHDNALVVIDDEVDRVPIAIVTDTDIAQAVADGRNLDEVRLNEVVSRAPITVSPAADVEVAAQLMIESGIRHLAVAEAGQLVGMIDISDACRALVAAKST